MLLLNSQNKTLFKVINEHKRLIDQQFLYY